MHKKKKKTVMKLVYLNLLVEYLTNMKCDNIKYAYEYVCTCIFIGMNVFQYRCERFFHLVCSLNDFDMFLIISTVSNVFVFIVVVRKQPKTMARHPNTVAMISFVSLHSHSIHLSLFLSLFFFLHVFCSCCLCAYFVNGLAPSISSFMKIA